MKDKLAANEVHMRLRNIVLFSVSGSIVTGMAAGVLTRTMLKGSALNSFGIVSQHCLIASLIYFGNRELLSYTFKSFEHKKTELFLSSTLAGSSTAVVLSRLLFATKLQTLKRHAIFGFGIGVLSEISLEIYQSMKENAKLIRIQELRRQL